MKKYLLILVLSVCSVSFLKAQDVNEGRRAEKIQALKIAFITQKLQLTPEEAQKFWPVYSQYENDLKAMQGNSRSGDVIDNEEKVLNIRKKYRSEFTKVLGQDRMNKLSNAEKDFRGVLLQRLKNRNNTQQQFIH